MRTPFTQDFAVSFPRSLLAFFFLASSCAVAQLKGFDLHGDPIDLAAAAPGKVNVLIFVRTDCPVSNRYAPMLQKLSAQYVGAARFWLVYPDRSESAETIARHLGDFGYTRLTALRDPQRTLVKLAHARMTPEAAVFSAEARLLYHGRIDNWYQSFGHTRPQPTTHELIDAIRAALAGRNVAVPETIPVGCYIADLQ